MYASPAKLNLFFRTLHKRVDGCHEIASLYSAVDLCDFLNISRSRKDQFFSTDESLEKEYNSVLYARDLFRRVAHIDQSIAIELEKNIPKMSGLGGGSSNAATTLWALNQLFNYPLSDFMLHKIAKQIGMDVSFFLSSGTAFCTSGGEEYFNVAPPAWKSFYVVYPNEISASTVKVYQNHNMENASGRDPHEIWHAIERKEPVFMNDLEQSSFDLYPKLKEIKEHLIDMGLQNVSLTGSGSAMFGLGDLKKPLDPSLFSVFRVSPIQREKNSWYQKDTCIQSKNIKLKCEI